MDKHPSFKSFRLWSHQSDGEQYEGLDQKQLIPVLISAIKELEENLENINKKLNNLLINS